MSRQSRDALGGCCATVYGSGYGPGYACQKRATVERGGRKYCGTHDPVAKRARQSKRNAERDEHYAQIRDAHEKRERIEKAERALIDAMLAYSGPLAFPAPIDEARDTLIAAKRSGPSSSQRGRE